MVRRSGTQRYETGKAITTQSVYGSHTSMVVSPEEHNVELQDNEVVCQDDIGLYVTTEDRIDSGLADPRRYARGRS